MTANTKSSEVKDLVIKKITKKENLNTLIPGILTEMFALLKTGIQKMRNISVNSPKRCAS